MTENHQTLSSRTRALRIQLIRDALERHKDNRTRAAKELDIPLRTLREWLKTYPELADLRRPSLKPLASR